MDFFCSSSSYLRYSQVFTLTLSVHPSSTMHSSTSIMVCSYWFLWVAISLRAYPALNGLRSQIPILSHTYSSILKGRMFPLFSCPLIGQNFRRTQFFGGQDFRHELENSAVSSGENNFLYFDDQNFRLTKIFGGQYFRQRTRFSEILSGNETVPSLTGDYLL